MKELIAKRAVKVNRGHPPRLANRFRAARHRHVGQMRDAPGSRIIGDEELAAPEPAILAESESVHCHADDFAIETVVRHATRDVRVMMLDADLKHDSSQRQRVFRREIFGMQIVSDDFRLKVEEPLEMLDAVRK